MELGGNNNEAYGKLYSGLCFSNLLSYANTSCLFVTLSLSKAAVVYMIWAAVTV